MIADGTHARADGYVSLGVVASAHRRLTRAPNRGIPIMLSAVGGTVVHAVSLDAAEDGDLLRAVGYSVQNPTQNASYTVTLIDLSPTGA